MLLCLVVGLTLLASFFLPSHLSLKHVFALCHGVYVCMYAVPPHGAVHEAAGELPSLPTSSRDGSCGGRVPCGPGRGVGRSAGSQGTLKGREERGRGEWAALLGVKVL